MSIYFYYKIILNSILILLCPVLAHPFPLDPFKQTKKIETIKRMVVLFISNKIIIYGKNYRRLKIFLEILDPNPQLGNRYILFRNASE